MKETAENVCSAVKTELKTCECEQELCVLVLGEKEINTVKLL